MTELAARKEGAVRIAMAMLLVMMFCFELAGSATAAQPVAERSVQAGELNQRCLGCHDDYLYRTRFTQSVHADNGCLSCHTDIRNLARHAAGEVRPKEVACGSCHAEIARSFRENAHYLAQDFRCFDCHRDIHAQKKSEQAKSDLKKSTQENSAQKKKSIIDRCTGCHSPGQYVSSGHGQKVLAGNRDAASCADCHGIHDMPLLLEGAVKDTPQKRVWFTKRCVGCHGDEEMMKRSGLSTLAVRSYESTYHGKVRKAGYPSHVAGCADCHDSHNIKPPSDPSSPMNPANLVVTCGKCHSGFHPRFVSFNAHPDYGDRKKYPALFWTLLFMEGLLIGVFAFFWVHTGLWWRKAYWEKCRKERADALPPVCQEEQIERFPVLYRLMHFILILSFFTLVLTGLPLKYSGTVWSAPLFRMLGGVANAGLLHRIAAVILSILFLYTVWLSVRFLFSGISLRQNLKSGLWWRRLFGPDSLFPNLKDLRDIRDMFRWFFNRGELPLFDRWTYWEKFDFLAVFWGMAAIGGSGLLLWFPEFFSFLFPGWVINVATIVHSEEALLAALFIFTVHFFNNHLLPEKFPLEANIFTGRNSVDQLRHERPLEYERLLREERLEALKRKPTGVRFRLIISLVGLAALAIGLLLVLVIVLTLFY